MGQLTTIIFPKSQFSEIFIRGQGNVQFDKRDKKY